MNKQNNQQNSEYIRVTEVLSPFSGLDKVPRDILTNAANRGTKVHKICESIVKGLGDWGVDDETKPYVESFKKWWATDIKVLAVEERFYCPTLKITGQIDMIIETSHGAAILDLKTSYKPSKTWALQGSAYKYLAQQKGYNIESIQFLHLSKLGESPKLIEYEDCFDLYKKCLDVYRHFYT